jgi:hypothetical protein
VADVITRATYQYALKATRRLGQAGDWVPGGNFNIFQVVNGCVLIKRIWGHVTTACANNVLVPFLNFTPTGGGGATALCALAAGAAHAINVVLTWSGVVAGVLTPTATLGHSAASGTATETFSGSDLICVPGIISITNATTDATAVIDWYIQYWPAAPNALVIAL